MKAAAAFLSFWTKPRWSWIESPAGRVGVLVACAAMLIAVILGFAPRRIAEMRLTPEQTLIAWLLVAVAVIACAAWTAMLLAAAPVIDSRAANWAGAPVVVFIPGGILSAARLNLDTAQLLAWVLLVLTAGILSHTAGLAIALLLDRRRSIRHPSDANISPAVGGRP